jgi:hypothetical protein
VDVVLELVLLLLLQEHLVLLQLLLLGQRWDLSLDVHPVLAHVICLGLSMCPVLRQVAWSSTRGGSR